MIATLFRKAALTALLALGALAAAAACEMSFTLVDASGAAKRVLPGSTVGLRAGSGYTLRVEFVEDHRNCAIPPEDTFFLMGGSEWRPGSADQGLALSKPITWVEDSRSRNRAEIAFTAPAAGDFHLGIIRDCPKGGYDERIVFAVK